ncbi:MULTISPECIES: LacI family DNA-binding transcriptional regulator [Paenibacillus]|uniref:LacI family DNA-binding transcriptional regulator n=1 Tax=Paenibacillus TaxID=44249 RepID=UPI0011A95701|nr:MULTISPECIES: LacI family DNA-binding transcriptional regulator [Paenibacillus]MBJ9992304.1 LacI family DNA-binding transcriptional regulator [Paenibacillus sp. S28]
METKPKVTIDDVAREAGVSKSTVSRIINNVSGVKPYTKLKVNRVIQELGFTPNNTARSLKTKLSRQIALAIDDIRNPYYPELAWAAEQVAKENDFRLVLINHYGNPSEELRVIKEASDMRVDGIVLLSISHPKTLTKVVREAAVPVALIGNYPEDMPADWVGLRENEGYLAMDHLIRIGRRRIAFAGNTTLHRGDRYTAYVQSLSSHFIELNDSLVYTGERLAIDTGLEAARYFYHLDERPDAVFAANDLVAIGVAQGLIDLGLRVPEDVAVVGIDNIPWCSLTTPKLSSVSNLVAEMGRIAVEKLILRIGDESKAFERIILEPRLIVRESTVKQM